MEFVNFFFYGCWNLCEKIDSENMCARNRVIYTIYKMNQNALNKFDFGILGGDNHYPNHISKKYKWTDFFDGFIKLSKLKIPIYGVLGNHDFSNKNKIQVQLHLHSIHHFFENIHIFNFEIKDHKSGKIRFIFINTSLLYTLEVNKVIYFYKFICNNCIDVSKVNFIIGHHPIFGFERIIESNTKLQYIHLPHYHILCKYVLNKINECPDLKIYYLCSDIHNFQINEIYLQKNPKVKFTEIICGTGGGIPNNIHLCDLDKVATFGEMCVKNIKKSNAYGFLSVQVFNSGNIKFTYKKV